MEPALLALVCATVFGVVGIISAFIRQLLLSREKRLNDLAQQRALQQETTELEKIRQEMTHYQRFDRHYQVLGENKETIQYLDQRIEDVLKKKSDLIKRYAEAVNRESSAIIAGHPGEECKQKCDQLKIEIDRELEFYESELSLLQKRRASLWDNHKDLLNHLLDQEKLRDDHLDDLYKQHSAMLEKVYLRHNENSEAIGVKTIDASTSTFKAVLMAPIYFLMGVFKISSNIDPEQASTEKESREEVYRFELDINSVKTTKSPVKKPAPAKVEYEMDEEEGSGYFNGLGV